MPDRETLFGESLSFAIPPPPPLDPPADTQPNASLPAQPEPAVQTTTASTAATTAPAPITTTAPAPTPAPVPAARPRPRPIVSGAFDSEATGVLRPPSEFLDSLSPKSPETSTKAENAFAVPGECRPSSCMCACNLMLLFFFPVIQHKQHQRPPRVLGLSPTPHSPQLPSWPR